MLSTEEVQKPELKLLGISVDEQLRFTTQHLQERCKSCRRDIEIIYGNKYLHHQIANCQSCIIATCHCQLMPDARKLEKLQERALCAVRCNKRIIMFG